MAYAMKTMRRDHAALAVAIILFLIGTWTFWRIEWKGETIPFPQEFSSAPSVRIETSTGAIEVPVEVATTPRARQRGLADRDAFAPDRGMLFVFEADGRPVFAMAGMRFGLDMVFLTEERGGDARVVHIEQNLPSCPERVGCVSVAPKADVRFVLEVNAGFVDRTGIRLGDQAVIVW